MVNIRKIDLTHAISFMGFLLCKKELARMHVGSILEVTLDNPDFIDDLSQIIERSDDRIVEQKRVGRVYKICIRKGCIAEQP
jgi:TusA-related sulfurtransferase